MSSLQFSPTLGRKVRQDSNTDLGRPTRPFITDSVQSGQVETAKDWLDYFQNEIEAVYYIFEVWNWYMADYYLQRSADQTLHDLLELSMAPWLATTAGMSGEPFAAIHSSGHGYLLSAEGLTWKVHVLNGDKRFHLTLGLPEEQRERWESWRKTIDRAIEEGEISTFNKLLDQHIREVRLIHDVLADWSWALLTVIANKWGEEILEEVLRVTEEPWVTVRYESLKTMSLEDSLQITIEGMRGHFGGPDREGSIEIEEHSDRYELIFDACGTGSRMRRGDSLAGSGPRTESPYNFLMVQGSYDWTWNRKGVCAYCSHCGWVNQIFPIEQMGHPMRMTKYPDESSDACRWIIYKDNNNYPVEAYTEVGKPTPSRQKN